MLDASSIESAGIPRVREGIDLVRAGLSLEEGFLVSRVDGHTPVDMLAVLVGKSVEETEKLVQRLARAGVLVLGEDAQPPEGVVDNDADFPPDVWAEPVDLSNEEKRRILRTHARLSETTHYALLGVRWRDDAKTIKRAYFERSKEWHPDRFRRPRLGSYKTRIDEIFRAVRHAYAVLSDSEKKRAYDQVHAPGLDEADMAEMLADQRRAERLVRREEERRRRRLERNPMRQRMVKAKGLFERAMELQAEGRLLESLHAVQAAQTFHDRPEYRKLRRELQVATGELRVAPLMRRGQHAESMTSWREAVDAYMEAVRLAPEHGPARLRLAYNMLMAGRPVQDINEHVHHALQLLPEDPEAHFLRGLCYERGGMEKAAVGAFQRVLELKPNHAEAKKRLKRLRWGF